MPDYVAVEEPWTSIVRREPDRNVITLLSDAHNVADNGVDEVVGRLACATDHVEGMSMKVNRMLYADKHESCGCQATTTSG
jgi:hypothetical protein